MESEFNRFQCHLVRPGDIVVQWGTSAVGWKIELSRWIILDRALTPINLRDSEFRSLYNFKAALMGINPDYHETGSTHIGETFSIDPGRDSDEEWEVVVESGLSWGDQ